MPLELPIPREVSAERYPARTMLIPLDETHAGALAAFLRDFRSAGEARIPAYFCDPAWPITQVVTALDGWARGEGLAEQQVPCTTRFWSEGDELVGVVNVRHRLNARLRFFGGHVGYSVRPSARRRGIATQMLASALPLARALGIGDVLLTCAPDNHGSIRAIEANGGQLEAEELYAPEGRMVRRYWIRSQTPAALTKTGT